MARKKRGAGNGDGAVEQAAVEPQVESRADAARRDTAAVAFEMRHHQPEQASLFPTADLVIPESIRVMRKAVSAIHAVPMNVEHNQTLNDRRVMDGLIMAVQIDCRGREQELVAQIRKDRVCPMFELSIQDIARLAGVAGKNYDRIYAALDALYEASYEWNIVAEDKQVIWAMKSHFLSILGRGSGPKRGRVRFAIEPTVLEFVLEPKIWAEFVLGARPQMGTSASYALWQNTFRYIGTANKVTAALPTDVWIELLCGKGMYIRHDPVLGKVCQYGDFKRRVLLDAMERVNAAQALNYTLELKELRQGNRVARLQFKFVPKLQQPLGLPIGWPKDLLDVLANMGYTEQEIADLAQMHTMGELTDALLRMKAAEERMKAQKKSVGIPRRYLKGILKNMAAAGDAEQDDKKDDEVIRQEELRRAAEERQERLAREFEDHQRARFETWLFEELAASERNDLVADYLATENVTPPVRKFFEKELSPSSGIAIATLRSWLVRTQGRMAEQAFPNPEDKTFDQWMAWRLDTQAQGAPPA